MTDFALEPNPDLCDRCSDKPSRGRCCSSHGKQLCHGCYRRTHFVELCVEGCSLCRDECLPISLAVAQ